MAEGTEAAPVTQSTSTETQVTSNTTPIQASGDAASKKVEEVKKEIRRLKLKVNGSEREMPENDVIALAQKAMASDEKFRKASDKEKRLAAIAKAAETDPEAIDELLKTMFGKDPEEIYKQRLGEKLKRMSMDPKDLELYETKEKLRKYEESAKKREEEAQAAKVKQAEDHYAKEYDKSISKGLQDSGLPINEDTVRMTAEIMLANLEMGNEMPISTVMELVRDKYHKNFKKLFGDYDPEKLIEFLGEDVFRKLQTADSKRRPDPAKQGAQHLAPKADGDDSKAEEVTSDGFRDRIKKWSGK